MFDLRIKYKSYKNIFCSLFKTRPINYLQLENEINYFLENDNIIVKKIIIKPRY